MNQSHEQSRRGYRIFLRTGAPLRNRVIDWSCDVPNSSSSSHLMFYFNSNKPHIFVFAEHHLY